MLYLRQAMCYLLAVITYTEKLADILCAQKLLLMKSIRILYYKILNVNYSTIIVCSITTVAINTTSSWSWTSFDSRWKNIYQDSVQNLNIKQSNP